MQRFLEISLVVISCLGILVSTVVYGTHDLRRELFTSSEHAYRNSVAKLITQPGPNGDEGGIATGFAIDTNRIVTAGHFCEHTMSLLPDGKTSDKILIETANNDGSPLKLGEAIIAAISNESDLCILYLEDHGLIPLELASDTDLVYAEDRIIIIGAPVGMFPVKREGFVVANPVSDRFPPAPHTILLAVVAQAGNSGSPIMWNNKVIGILISIPFGLQNAALGERVEALHKFLATQ